MTAATAPAVSPRRGRARRAFKAALLLVPLAACAGGGGTTVFVPSAPLSIQLVPVVTGLTAPLQLTHCGDGSGRMFVIEQVGRIRVIDAGGTLLAAPFLDLSALMVVVDPSFDERGLLGLAFHPNYPVNGRFFVRYSAARPGAMGEPCFGTGRGCHESVLSEFAVQGDPLTSNVADPNSQIVLLRVPQPEFNHNGGHVAFDSAGRLFTSLGDGGGANDGLDLVPPSHGPFGNGQNIDTLLGKILRIDVDSPPPIGLPYAIPADNPFAMSAGADEIYAYGMRNPYRFSFDDGPGGTGALYVGDVGQDLFEEVDIVVRGGNYGWVIREGFECFDPFDPDNPPPACAVTGPLGEPLLPPVLVYDHGEGLAIVGGFVYRGAGIPAMAGHYVFGDFSRDFGPTGRLFHANTVGPEAFVLKEFTLTPGPTFGRVLFGFGRDQAGEIYVMAAPNFEPVGTLGEVLRIEAP